MKPGVFQIGLLWTLLGILLTSCATNRPKPGPSPEEHARLLLDVANAALVENDPTSALEALDRAEAIDPGLAELYNTRALALYVKNDAPGAIESIQKSLKLAPEYPDANNTYGKILLDLGRYDEAAPLLLKAAHSPYFREAYKSWTSLGILYYRKGEISKASEDFEKAVQGGGERACIAYYYKGHLKLREGDYTEAIRDYGLATRKWCGGFADAHLAIGITYERTKQYDLARRTYLEVEQRYPNTKSAEQAVNRLKALP